MPSIILGYEYDIFISYRQKDNKYDGWVTEFIGNLKKELEATFKEDVSVYFDINPHDGLLETHDVDASLKDKLKCLVFIPIISRTYCDQKSFAWEHEFKAFVEQASQDQFGLKVKLPTGNVASRILPVQIHELEPGDKKLLENELGGFLRGIEFIYREPGVNRPLKPEDDEKRNLGKTIYRNQINKAANALNEIISGLRSAPVTLTKENTTPGEQDTGTGRRRRSIMSQRPMKLTRNKLFSFVIISVVLITIVISNLNLFRRDKYKSLKDQEGKISIAVLPFNNLTNDTLLNLSGQIIQIELISFLTNFKTEFAVRQVSTTNTIMQAKNITGNASITPSVAGDISQKLAANVFIDGAIEKSGGIVRINAQVVDSKTEGILKTFSVKGPYKNELDLKLIDTLRSSIKDFLIISVLEKKLLPSSSPYFSQIILRNSLEAYKYCILGFNAFYKTDYPTAITYSRSALERDPDMFEAMITLYTIYSNIGLADSARKWCLKAYAKRNLASDVQKLWLDYQYAWEFGTSDDRIMIIKQILDFDDQNPNFYFQMGYEYSLTSRPEKAIPEYEKSLEITDSWGTKPEWVFNYAFLCGAYHQTGQYLKEKKLYLKAEKDFPDDQALLARQIILALSLKDTVEANKYLEKYRYVYLDKYKSIIKEPKSRDASLNLTIAILYWCANIPDKAKNYYRQAELLEPDSLKRIYILDDYLLGTFQSINEGIDYLSKSQQTFPNNYRYVYDKGVGLFKQGKYDEALKLLNKCLTMYQTPQNRQNLLAMIKEVEKFHR